MAFTDAPKDELEHGGAYDDTLIRVVDTRGGVRVEASKVGHFRADVDK